MKLLITRYLPNYLRYLHLTRSSEVLIGRCLYLLLKKKKTYLGLVIVKLQGIRGTRQSSVAVKKVPLNQPEIYFFFVGIGSNRPT